MLAIPLDTKDATTLSKLYGRAPFFALLNMDDGYFKVVENEVMGKGPKSAGFLKEYGVSATIFYHMGEGVYKSFVENDMDVYTGEHQSLTIDEVFLNFSDNNVQKVDNSNFQELLDPGEGETCQCGCDN